MKILVIDGQGGGIGRQLIEGMKKQFPEHTIHAVGTNSAATLAMRKAGADLASTGENALLVACRTADLIVGPVGVAIADSLLGEISPKMAVAVGQSSAARILLPMAHCCTTIAGAGDLSSHQILQSALKDIEDFLTKNRS